MFSRHLQSVFKTSCKSLFNTFSRRLQDVLKTSKRHLEESLIRLAKMPLIHFQDIFKTSSRGLQNVFKMYHKVKMLLLKYLQLVFKTFLRRIEHIFKMYSEDDYLQKNFPRPHFREIYGEGTDFSRGNSLDIQKLFEQFF